MVAMRMQFLDSAETAIRPQGLSLADHQEQAHGFHSWSWRFRPCWSAWLSLHWNRQAVERGQALFGKASRLERGGIVVFEVLKQPKDTFISRYAPYLAYPEARYSIGILPYREGAKITAMRNPWRRFESRPLGQIFRRYGGGGHQRVASVLLKDKAKAESTLNAILNDIRSEKEDAPKRTKAVNA